MSLSEQEVKLLAEALKQELLQNNLIAENVYQGNKDDHALIRQDIRDLTVRVEKRVDVIDVRVGILEKHIYKFLGAAVLAGGTVAVIMDLLKKS